MSGKRPGTVWLQGYERRYAVGPDGTVWGCVHPFPRRLKVRVDTDGHATVTLYRAPKVRRVHRLAWVVLEAFGPRRKPGQVPIFRDGNPLHCTLANLRWGTEAERRARALRAGAWGRKLTPEDVRRIFHSRRSAGVLAREYGLTPRRIRSIWYRERWAVVTRRWKRPA